MGYECEKDLRTKYDTIEKLTERINKELDEEYPWMGIIRWCNNKIAELNKKETS